MSVANLQALLTKKCGVALGSALTVLQLCSSWNSLCAIQPDNYFDIGGGYRYDRLTTKTKAFGTPVLQFLAGERDQDKFLFKDKIKAKRMDIYVLQANAQVRFCDYWFARGYASYGWMTDGRYHEERKNRFLIKRNSRSDIHDSRTRDWSAGFGYLYPGDGWWGCWGFGPVIGWSYDDQLLKMGTFTTDGFEDPILRNLQYRSRWSGPWAGFDFVYKPHCYPVKLSSSLEYHWATWHGERRLDHSDIPFVIYTDRRKSNNANGLLFTADGQWNFWCNWHMSLACRILFYHSDGGRVKPKHGSFKQLGFPYIEKIKLKNTRWYSDTYTFNIGYDF